MSQLVQRSMYKADLSSAELWADVRMGCLKYITLRESHHLLTVTLFFCGVQKEI